MSNADRSLTLALVGDLYVNRPEPVSIFAPTADVLREADVLFGNCETPIAERGEPWPGKPLANNCLKMPPESAAALAAVGFDAVGLASNHSLDFGIEALLRTRELLDEQGVQHAGAGRNLDEARRPAIVTKNGVTIAFLVYSSVYMPGWEATSDRAGIATVHVDTAYKPHPRIHEQPGAPATTLTFPDPNDVARLKEDIQMAKRRADIVVVSWHWGVSERHRLLVPYQVDLGHLALDVGADLVIGHHPHMLQGVEIYQGKPLFYSLGNFAFDVKHPWFGPESVIVRCLISHGRIDSVSVVPCLIDEIFAPRPLGLDDSSSVIGLLKDASADFGTRFERRGNEVVVGL
jgi:poly-gamma-glutamate capsule biosynthesis protein CapA/YwtB (metallophosphatase superfamily)